MARTSMKGLKKGTPKFDKKILFLPRNTYFGSVSAQETRIVHKTYFYRKEHVFTNEKGTRFLILFSE